MSHLPLPGGVRVSAAPAPAASYIYGAPNAPEHVAETGEASGVPSILRALRRRWWLVAGMTFVATGLMLGVVKSLPPRFTASVDIVIEREDTTFADLQREARAAAIDPAEMETHLRVLGSDRLALGVIDGLDLEPPPPAQTAWTSLVARARALADAAGLSDTQGDAGREPTGGQGRMLEEFRARLAIDRDPLARVITVSYTDDGPERAAAVANAVADAFLAELVSARRATLAQSADYLRERVTALGAELGRFERGAKDHQNSSELYQVQGAPVAELRYGELTRALAEAEALRNRARARVAQLGKGGQMSEELVTLVMAELRKQEAEVARRVADFSSRFGAKHPAMIDARAELADIQRNLKAEQTKITREVQTELKVAEAQVRDLREQIAATERRLAKDSGAQVRLQELRTQADTTRATYQDMLDRFQRATEQQHLLRPPARVISAARPPSRPDGKHALLLLGFAAMSSLAGGMGLALLLELGRRGYDTAEQLGRDTGIAVYGSLPLIRRGMSATRDESLEAAVFTEAIHRTVARVVPPTAQEAPGCQVVGVTSALPDEGKSTLSLSIGRQLARRGRRVLLIHADMHKEISPALRLECEQPEHDLLELLAAAGSVPFEQAVLHDPRSGLQVLAAREVRPDAATLLASPAFKRLLDGLRPSYDVILIDTPPVLAVSDYALIAGFADQLLFVVRWQATPRRAVRTALREVLSIGLPLRGLVLNQVELQAYRRRAPEDALGFYRETSRYYRGRAA